MELVSHLEAALEHTDDPTARYHIRAALQYARSFADDPEATAVATGLDSVTDTDAVDTEAED